MRHRVGRGIAVLDLISEPFVNLTLWQRNLPANAKTAARAFAQANPGFDAEGPLTDAQGLLATLAPGVGADWLRADVARLASWMGSVAGEPLVARLIVASSCGSPKWHTDGHRLRLVCTYCGSAGTEWVPEHAVNRLALAAADDLPSEEANRLVVPSAKLVRRAKVGDVLVMTGESWPGSAGGAAFHRSPSVGPEDAPRLLLRITARRFRGALARTDAEGVLTRCSPSADPIEDSCAVGPAPLARNAT